mgnify:CR=1 FL=1
MAGLFGSGPQSNILQVVQGSYTNMLNAEKQKGISMTKAMGAFGQAISPKAIGMNQFKNDFKGADWSKPETYQRAGEQIMPFDPQAGLSMMDKGRALTAQMAPKRDMELVEGWNPDTQAMEKTWVNKATVTAGTTQLGSKPIFQSTTKTGEEIMAMPEHQGQKFDPTTVFKSLEKGGWQAMAQTGEGTGDAFKSFTKTGEEIMAMPEHQGQQYDPTTVFRKLQDGTWAPVSKTGVDDSTDKGTTLRQNAETIAGEGATDKQIVNVMRQLGGIASDMQVPVREIMSITNSFQTTTENERKKIKGADNVIDLTAEDAFPAGMKADQISSIADNLTRSLFGDNALKAQAEMDAFRASKRFTRKIADLASNFIRGTHTTETLKGFQELAKFVKERETDSYNDKRQNQANALAVSSNLKPDQIETILGPVKGTKWIQPDGTPFADNNYELNGDLWRVRSGIGYIKYKKGEF